MSMNQPSPADLQALIQQQGQQQPDPESQQPMEEQDPFGGQAMTGGHPDAQTADQLHQLQLDPMEVLPEVILSYMDFAQEVRHDQQLDKQVKSKIMLEQSQAISGLLAHVLNAQQDIPEAQMLELQMKAQAHAHDLQMKQQQHEQQLSQQAEKHQLEMEKLAAHLQGDEIRNAQTLVHTEQKHKQQLQQQKQAAQSKQPKNPSSK